jgi:signal transduction histidine kinase
VRRLTSRSLWVVVGILVMVAGCAATWMSATSLRNAAVARDEAAFTTAAYENIAELQTEFALLSNLDVAAQAFLVDNPNADQAALMDWAGDIEAMARNPDVVAISIIRRTVPGDPRCVAAASVVRPGSHLLPPGLDHCAGRGITVLNAGVFGVASGPLIDEAAEVEGAGWMVISVDPAVTLHGVIGDDPGYELLLHVTAPGGEMIVSSGAAPEPAETRSVGFGANWALDVRGPEIKRGLTDRPEVMPLLRTGVGLSLLTGILLMVLATGRIRAMRLVEKRTAQLDAAHRSLDTLLRDSISANEGVRTRFAQELHDGPIQRLSALGLTSERLFRRIEPDNSVARDLAKRVRMAITAEIDGLRHLMVEMRPPALDEGGVAGAISDLCVRFQADTGIACVARVEGTREISPTLETVLYRVLQHRLDDVAQFHLATSMRVALQTVDGDAILTMEHDGGGSANRESPAFAVMRHRAETAGGHLDIEDDGAGHTTARLHLPLDGVVSEAPEPAVPLLR